MIIMIIMIVGETHQDLCADHEEELGRRPVRAHQAAALRSGRVHAVLPAVVPVAIAPADADGAGVAACGGARGIVRGVPRAVQVQGLVV